ncbi:hypothetical protein, conserved [Leishmania tarentolae]|uniref:Leucine-rich repeat protein n=1 Tax=Leishmania tarentolae TaxID=5689 RepID=A0A640KBD4_LEITA|nr:hypothetical protein, conserved [Leishmania tarentolae]
MPLLPTPPHPTRSSTVKTTRLAIHGATTHDTLHSLAHTCVRAYCHSKRFRPMSVPHLTAEDVAYYASLRLEDPDEAALAAFLGEAQQAHEVSAGDTGASPSRTMAPTSPNGEALRMSSPAPVCEHLSRSSVEGVQLQCTVSPVDQRGSSASASTVLGSKRLSARMFPGSRPTATGTINRYGVKEVLERKNLVGGIEGIADAVLQTRCVELPARQLTSIACIQCFLNATHVYLQHNALVLLEGIELLSQLQVLVVHHNQLTSLAPLQQLECLSYLDVSHNNVSSSLDVLLRDELPCPSLKCLNLSENPCWNPRTEEVSDADGEERHRAYVQQICTACPLLERLDNVDVDDGEEVVQHSDNSTENSVSNEVELRSTDATPSQAGGITVRRVQGSVEAARAASSLAFMRDIHTGSSPAPPDSLATSEADLSVRQHRRAHVSKAHLLEEEQARWAHQLILRCPVGTAPERPKVLSTVSTLLLHPDRSSAGSGHPCPGDAAAEAPTEHTQKPPAGRAADVSALYSTGSSTFQLYHNLQFTQEVSQARLQREVAAHWDDVSRVLQTAQALQQDRRRRMQQRVQEPTPAYTESLRLLEKESFTKNLDRYRSSDGSRRGAQTGTNAASGVPVTPPALAVPNVGATAAHANTASDGNTASASSNTPTHPPKKPDGKTKKGPRVRQPPPHH